MDFSEKPFNFTLRDIFHPYFSAFLKPVKYLQKCSDIELLYRYQSIMVFHGLLTKGRPLKARHKTKDFNGKSGRLSI